MSFRGLIASCTAYLLAMQAWAQPLPDFPDPLGRAGLMAVVLKEKDGQEIILAAGGSNFPDKKLWEGGQKTFYKDIYKLHRVANVWRWTRVGELPAGLLGGAAVATPKADGMIIAGGASAQDHRREVWHISREGQLTRFAEDLPTPRAYAGFTVANNNLILIGGTAQPDATHCLATLTSLDLDDPDKPWRTSNEDPNYARLIPLCGASERLLLWGGGCILSAKDGKPFRSYQENLCHQSPGAQGNDFHGLPGNLAGPAGPGVATHGTLFFVGGDDGTQYGQPTETHPGLGRRILAIDLDTREVSEVGTWPHPVAVAPLVRLGDDLVTVSGETRPGVRTPAVTRWTIPVKYR